MSDRLLRELGDLARSETEAEKARFDDRWDRLAAGTLTAEEEAELKALSESSPEYQEAYEAFRPLGTDFQARVVRDINARRLPKPDPIPATPDSIRPKPNPIRPSPWRVIRRPEFWIGLPATLAAGVIFLVGMPAGQTPLPSAYMARLNAGDQVLRGGEQHPVNGIPTFSSGSRLELSANPLQPIPGKVEPQAFLGSSSGDEPLKPWKPEAHFQIADQGGALRLVGTVGQDLVLPSGDLTVWIVVSRPGRAPRVEEVLARLRSGRLPHEPWRSVCAALPALPSRPAAWQISCAELRIKSQPAS